MKMSFVFMGIVGVVLSVGCRKNTSCSQYEPVCADTSIVKNEVMNTILHRRSIRKFQSRPLEKEKMADIIKCGVYAPNGKGLQSWEVRIVDNPGFLVEMDSVYSCFMKRNEMKTVQQAAYGAPVLVFIAYDTTYDLSQVDCGLLGGNMMLAASSMGIGSCCLGGICRFFNAPEGLELLKRLDFPDTHRLLYAIAFGYPDEMPKAKTRNMEKVKYVE